MARPVCYLLDNAFCANLRKIPWVHKVPPPSAKRVKLTKPKAKGKPKSTKPKAEKVEEAKPEAKEDKTEAADMNDAAKVGGADSKEVPVEASAEDQHWPENYSQSYAYWGRPWGGYEWGWNGWDSWYQNQPQPSNWAWRQRSQSWNSDPPTTPKQRLLPGESQETLISRSDSGSDLDPGVVEALSRLRTCERAGSMDSEKIAQALEDKFRGVATPTKGVTPSTSPGGSTMTSPSQESPVAAEVVEGVAKKPKIENTEKKTCSPQAMNKEEAKPEPPEEKAATEEAKPKPQEVKATTEEAKPKPQEVKAPTEEAKLKPQEEKATTEEAKPKPQEEKATTEEAKPKPQEKKATTEEAKPKPQEEKATTEQPKPKPQEEKATTEEPKPKPQEEKATTEEAKPKPQEKKATTEEAKPPAEKDKGKDQASAEPKDEAPTEEDKAAAESESLRKRKLAAHARYMRYYRSVRGGYLTLVFALHHACLSKHS